MWYECESEGGAATVAALEKMSALTAHDDTLGAAVSAAEAELKISLFAAASNDPMLDSQPHYGVANLFAAFRSNENKKLMDTPGLKDRIGSVGNQVSSRDAAAQ